MLDFHKYLMRHGESWVQDIVERIERNQGISLDGIKTLEERWVRAMHDAATTPQRLAA